MSYILDALKKSEKERQRATVPGVLTVQDIGPKSSKKRVRWPYLLLAALVLNAGLFFWWLNPPQSEKANVAENSIAYEYRDSLQTVIPRTAESEKQEVSKKDIRQAEPVGAEVVQKGPLDTGTAVQKNVASVSQVEVRKTSKAAVVPEPQKTGVPPQNEVAPLAPVETEKPLEAAVPKPQPRPVIGQSSPESKPASQTATPADNKLHSLVDLPASVQQSLPSFAISAHVYSSDPASRMVKIDGKTMREGDELIAGLKLEEIAPDGVIFRYRNYRFRIGLR